MRTPAAPQTARSGRRADARRRGAPPRRVGVAGGWLQRRKPEKKQSGLAKAFGGLGGAVSRLGKGRAKPAKSSGKAKRGGQVGGAALLTAAAGLAFKNRDKVAAMLRRDQQGGAARSPEHVSDGPIMPPPSAAPGGRPGTVSGDAGAQA